MKRVINILVTTLCAAILFSCTHEYSFKTNAYVLMDEPSFSVKEDAGLVFIPVSAYNSESLEGTVFFNVIDGTAVQGTDFTVEPADGVLHFNGNGTEYIKINVIEHAGILTGSLRFSIELSAVDGEISNFGGVTSTSFEIKDNDVVVDWEYLVGTWNASDDGGTYEAKITKESETTLKLSNVGGQKHSITGTVTFDKETNTASILFAGGQVVYESQTYGPCGIFGNENDYWVDCKATVSSSGITMGPWYAVILTGEYQGYYLNGLGGLTTLTKK